VQVGGGQHRGNGFREPVGAVGVGWWIRRWCLWRRRVFAACLASLRRSKAAVVVIGAFAGLVYVLGLIVFTSGAMIVGLQIINAMFIASVLGIGMTWFQDLASGRPGLMTAIYLNTSRLGAVVAAPIVGLSGLFPLYVCAILATAGLVGVVVVATARRGVRA